MTPKYRCSCSSLLYWIGTGIHACAAFFCLFLLALWSLFLPVHAEESDTSKLSTNIIQDNLVSVTPYVRYLRDPNRTLSEYQVRSQLTEMAFVNQEEVNFGFQDDAFWFAFEMMNPTENDESLFLEFGYPLLDEIKVFIFDKDKKEPEVTYLAGDSIPFLERPVNHPNFAFPLAIKAQTDYQIIIYINTRSAVQVPMTVSNSQTFAYVSQRQAAFVGMIVGVMIVMALYNLLIYFSIKDNSYLQLTITLGFFSIFQVSLTGFGYQYFWPDSPVWNNLSLPFASNMTMVFFALFSNEFLSMRKTLPHISMVMKGLSIFCLTNAMLSFVVEYQIAVQVAVATLLVCLLVSFYAGVVLFRKGYKPARYFIIAFTTLILGTVIWALNKMGMTDRIFLTEYSINFGAICGVALLSLALADRINRETVAREKAQQTAIDHLDKYRKIYENSLEGMFRLDADRNLQACNPAFAELMGTLTESELLEHITNLSGFIPSEEETGQLLHVSLEENGHVFGFEARCKRLDGSFFWAAIFARRMNGEEGEFIEGSIVDISEKKESEQQLSYLARHDPLTGLLNRSEFERRLESALERAQKSDEHHALLFMDLDQFKIVNDTSGHGAGDELLKQIAKLFKSQLREEDHLARLGGDEFSILLESCPIKRAGEIGSRLRNEVSDFRFAINKKIFSCGVSIGVVPITKSSESIEQIFSLADTACYAAKDAGRNKVIIHDGETGEISRRQSEMEVVTMLREAIKQDDLVLYKQRIGALKPEFEGERYEILVRLKHEDKLIPPGVFLPPAERYNIISALDRWVVESYFKWLSERPEEKEQLVQVNINLSGQTIEDSEFAEFLTERLEKYQIPIEKICFEITESSAVTSLVETTIFLKNMRAKGLKFALDDFGSGFSSYSYLKMLPVDAVKIDGSFIKEILDDPFDLTMVKSITEIAHTIGLKVVAEFVENQEVVELLKELGVDLAQGYHIDKPSPL